MNLPFAPRDEDARLLTGAKSFADDARASGEVHGVFVRSPHAFALVRAIGGAAARSAPGVLAVLTAADMEAAGIGNVTLVTPVPNGPGLVVPHRPALAGASVRHVGDPVALVIRDGAGDIVGAIGISGDTSDKDEACAVHAIRSAGLTPIRATRPDAISGQRKRRRGLAPHRLGRAGYRRWP